MRYTDIIWDWNGTLVDDVACSVACVNDTLKSYGLPPTDIEQYLDTICPSLEEYYGRIIDLKQHTMLEILQSFQDGYEARLSGLCMMQGAAYVLDKINESGGNQYIVSSFEHNALTKHINMFGIADKFISVSGAGDILCGSKSDRAKKIVDSAEKAVYIGDSINDYLTAMEIGCDCILIAKGHQRRSDLDKCMPQNGYSVTVIDDISEVLDIL